MPDLGASRQLALSCLMRLINQIKLDENYDENLYRSLRPQVGSVAWRYQASIADHQANRQGGAGGRKRVSYVCSQPRRFRDKTVKAAGGLSHRKAPCSTTLCGVGWIGQLCIADEISVVAQCDSTQGNSSSLHMHISWP